VIERDHALSIKRQAQLLSISHASAYCRPKPVSDAELKLMRRVDELQLELPFAGARAA
jgi:putative transposase